MTTIIYFICVFIIIGVLGFLVWLGYALNHLFNILKEKKRQYNNRTKVYYVLNKDCQVDTDNLTPSVKRVFDFLQDTKEPLSCKEIADFLNLKWKQVNAILTILRKKEIVRITFQK